MASIDHWAQVAAMSRRSFTEHFRKETGLSFGDWRTRVKLHAALRFLSEGKKSITEIGGDLGYQNTSSFIEVFREQFGLSPKKYMERERANQDAVAKAQDSVGDGNDEKYE
jgi:AraC-like DNA-binding protein